MLRSLIFIEKPGDIILEYICFSSRWQKYGHQSHRGYGTDEMYSNRPI